MRYFITLSYNGEPFCGWQIQPNAPSVQQTLEEALAKVLRHPVSIVGAGRTDAGVHARNMTAHFDTEQSFTPAQLVHKLNRMMPRSVAIHTIRAVRPEAHARFDATSRLYHYHITFERDPFCGHLQTFVHHALDFERMDRAAQILFEYEDFTSFSKLHTDVKTNNCRIMQASWEPIGLSMSNAVGELSNANTQNDNATDRLRLDASSVMQPRWCFVIEADRFLRNMVRAIVGTLLDVGRGKLTEDDFRRIIETKDRSAAGTSAPAHGLFFFGATYPDLYID